ARRREAGGDRLRPRRPPRPPRAAPRRGRAAVRRPRPAPRAGARVRRRPRRGDAGFRRPQPRGNAVLRGRALARARPRGPHALPRSAAQVAGAGGRVRYWPTSIRPPFETTTPAGLAPGESN